MEAQKVHIKVFITKKMAFRAIIKPEGGFASSITVGGERWNKGEFPEHRDRILAKCRKLVEYLNNVSILSTRPSISADIDEVAVEAYKLGFQKRHGRPVRKWKVSPFDQVRPIIETFIQKNMVKNG